MNPAALSLPPSGLLAASLGTALDIRRWSDGVLDTQGLPLHPRTQDPAHRFHSAEQAEAVLRRLLVGGLAVLRPLVDPVGVRPWSDHELLRQAAQRLADGRLLLFELGASVEALPRSRSTTARSDGSPAAATPSALRTPPAAAAPQPAAIAPEDDLLAGTDQAAQAAALVLAAANDAPFCEVCEQRRRAARPA